MTTILLSAAGSAVGAQAGPIGAAVGKYIGASIGSAVDNMIFGAKKLPDYHGPRLSDLTVQASTYGKSIPIVFGNARLAGNVIWSRPIKQKATTKKVSSGGKGGGGSAQATQKQTTYTYSISMAIAICEGQIDEVVRVWADAGIIDPTKGIYRVYKGSENQNPDPYIESFEGVGKTPAYRGLSYVVIEDFPLANYGNRIPNFTFEVKRKALQVSSETPLENKIKAVVMIPGSGEFAYDTTVQKKIGGENVGLQFVQNGTQITINQNNRSNKADALVALDQLQSELPAVEWVSVVIGWFGNSTDAGTCVIKPGVEYNGSSKTTPETWSVGSFTRSTAKLITQVSGQPVYGGTPDDQSLVRYVTELRNRGYKILFYPFVFMDMPGKPWRGYITGSAADTASFFTKTNGYNAFVTHYANLLSNKVDAFSIGSELVGLTKVKSGSVFPAVSALVSLAATVKGIMASGTKITYAADWSEYHHTDGGWYNLDPLWASPNIDVIGIDAYFPLSDEPQNGYDKQKIIDGWDEGEGYDWYYSDVGRTNKVNLTPQAAWKNITWWWSNYHVNPDTNTTAWAPQSKKIWLTEYGFPSVDGCANQPNVFYDPDSTDSAFPRFSKGRVDFRAQRTAIEGSIDRWQGSDMIENMFLWAWDARPYPFYPDLRNVWSDGNLWLYGHWVCGKLGLSSVAAVISDICKRVGLPNSKLNLEKINDLVDGFVLNTVSPARAGIEQLQKGFFYEGIESDGKFKFIPRGNEIIQTIDFDKLIPSANKADLLTIKRKQELELPQKINVNFLNRSKDYQVGAQSAQRSATTSKESDTQNLSIVFNEWQAKRIADITLFVSWHSRLIYEFALPIEYAALEPSDVISISTEANSHIIRITDCLIGLNGEIRFKGIADDPDIYDFYISPSNEGDATDVIGTLPSGRFEILDLPAFPGDSATSGVLRFAAAGLDSNWQGGEIFRSDDDGENYSQFSVIGNSAIIGNILTVPQIVNPDLYDNLSQIEVLLISGELESISDLALLNGANAALIGEEIIQFKNAELISENKYKLTGLLRGRLGTEHKVSGHNAGERFVLLDENIFKEQISGQLIGLNRKYKMLSDGELLSSAVAIDFAYTGNSLKPLCPVHVKGSRDSSGNLTISWVRRTRIGGELKDGVDVPLSEDNEKYEVDVFNGSNVVRTLAVSNSSAAYSSAQQITDFGANQPSLSVKIYQISSIVGRGIPAEKII